MLSINSYSYTYIDYIEFIVFHFSEIRFGATTKHLWEFYDERDKKKTEEQSF